MKLTLTLLLVVALGTATSATETLHEPVISQDTLPAGNHTVSSYRNNQYTKVSIENGEIATLSIDGRAVSPDSFTYYQSTVETLFDPSVRNRPLTKGPNREDRLYKLESRDDDGHVYHREAWKGLGTNIVRLAEVLDDIDVDIDIDSYELEGSLEEIADDIEQLGEELAASIERAFEGRRDKPSMKVSVEKDGKKVIYDTAKPAKPMETIDMDEREDYLRKVKQARKDLKWERQSKGAAAEIDMDDEEGNLMERSISQTLRIMEGEGYISGDWQKIKFEGEGFVYFDDKLAAPIVTARFLELFEERIRPQKGVTYSFEFDRNQ